MKQGSRKQENYQMLSKFVRERLASSLFHKFLASSQHQNLRQLYEVNLLHRYKSKNIRIKIIISEIKLPKAHHLW